GGKVQHEDHQRVAEPSEKPATGTIWGAQRDRDRRKRQQEQHQVALVTLDLEQVERDTRGDPVRLEFDDREEEQPDGGRQAAEYRDATRYGASPRVPSDHGRVRRGPARIRPLAWQDLDAPPRLLTRPRSCPAGRSYVPRPRASRRPRRR